MNSSDLSTVKLSAYEPAKPANLTICGHLQTESQQRLHQYGGYCALKYHRMFCFLNKSRLKLNTPLTKRFRWYFGATDDLRPVLAVHPPCTEGRRRTTRGVILDFTQAVEHIYHPLMKSSHTELVVIPTATNETWRARNERPTMTTWV